MSVNRKSRHFSLTACPVSIGYLTINLANWLGSCSISVEASRLADLATGGREGWNNEGASGPQIFGGDQFPAWHKARRQGSTSSGPGSAISRVWIVFAAIQTRLSSRRLQHRQVVASGSCAVLRSKSWISLGASGWLNCGSFVAGHQVARVGGRRAISDCAWSRTAEPNAIPSTSLRLLVEHGLRLRPQVRA